MMGVILTSAVLILILLILRFLFRNTISRRVQYALWGLVLLRLLLPFNLPPLSFSVLNAGQEMQSTLSRSMEREVYLLPVSRTPAAEAQGAESASLGGVVSAESFGYPVLSKDGDTVTKYAGKLTVLEVLRVLWQCGMAVMAVLFLATNLRFLRRLQKTRVSHPVEGCRYPVYLCEGLPTPCLFGVLRPAVYLPPAAASSPDRLRHILAHEETHARHLDPLWSALRCACLTIYWFHPLVWAAAVCSKADCELACDESVIRRLGEGERIPYGETLLSLIPVRRGNPLLSSTSMTAGKRRLKERLTRIVKRRKPVAAALAAVSVLTAVIGACTFTGAERGIGAQNRPLTAEELRYFNEVYFNGPDVDGSVYLNPHNYFISSVYDSPADIDLYELFYLELPEEFGGGVRPSERECALAFGQTPEEMPCAWYKLTTADMDAFLKEYTGLALDETNKKGLDQFTYLPEYDAYYWAHGDTNYQQVRLLTGERKDGLIYLYYDASYTSFANTGYACLTLKEVEDGCLFLSNQVCEKPAVPTVPPEGKPDLTLPLDALPPHEEVLLPVRRRTGDCAERLDGYSTGERSVCRYRSTDGKLYAAVVYDPAVGRDGVDIWDVGTFLTLPDDEKASGLDGFSNLFGRGGVVVSYTGVRAGWGEVTIHDYVAFTGDGAPVLLARVYGEDKILDLNGDGVDELVGDSQIFYQKGGRVYEADLRGLLEQAWPGPFTWKSGVWNTYARTLRVTVLSPAHSGGKEWDATVSRCLYFDGESLLIYPGPRTADHVLEGLYAPAEVLAAAKEIAEADYEAAIEPVNRRLNQYTFDDWRVSLLERVNLNNFKLAWPNAGLAVYRCEYQLRTPTPWDGHLRHIKVDEEGWLLDTFHNTRYLVFRVESGQWSRLAANITDYNISDEELQRSLLQVLIQNGLLSPGDPAMRPADCAQAALNATAESGVVALTLDTGNGVGGGRYVVAAGAGNGPNRLCGFGAAFDWEFSPEGISSALPQGLPTILVESAGGSASLQCWDGSAEVLCTLKGETCRLTASAPQDGADVFDISVFAYLRLWYDEAEYAGLSAPWVVPDRGQSREEVAQEMADLIYAAELKVTPGSMFSCTYVRNVASIMENLPDGYFPAAAEGAERFGFSFDHIFVPGNERSLYGHMAGNTGEYGGEHGPAPEHAFSNSAMGGVYLTGEGWRCDEVGTG